ncbi:hypothetical protein DFH08DRAFT_941835 [Mycena albidolilacea]|uniref:Uncharacterized protein n=1 Tax=Mycena albidolilacea TaxID=1033008 RepID=A0AAD6ZGY3_9AGAR|nr:hypothetical protein DFH08DRAFT_941835 [Mycena albidolilacea]
MSRVERGPQYCWNDAHGVDRPRRTTHRRAPSWESSGKALGKPRGKQAKMRRAGQTGRIGEGKAKVRSLKSSKSIEFLEGSGSGSGNSATPLAFEGAMRRPRNASSVNLVAAATAPP